MTQAFKIDNVDHQFIDGLNSLIKDGMNIDVEIEMTSAVEICHDREYTIPRDRSATMYVTTHTIEELITFESWLEKQNFRFALKGMPMVRCSLGIHWVSVTYR